jgi:hypothetical protein
MHEVVEAATEPIAQPEALLARNLTLMEKICNLIQEVSAHYTYFILEEFTHTFEGCHLERRLSSLRREMEVWLLHTKMPE